MPVYRIFQYKHSDRWYYSFTVKGRRYRKSTGCTRKSDANKIAKQAYEEAIKSPSSSNAKITLANYVEKYIQSVMDSGKTKSTVVLYHKALNKFREYVGNIPIGEISKAHLESYKDHRKSILLNRNGSNNIKASNTINIEIRAIKTAFNTAVRFELLNSNPLKDVKQYRIPKIQKRIHLNKAEISDLLNYIDSEIPDMDIGKFIKLCLFTGCRSMSALELKWEDIDLGENTIIFVNKPGGTYKIPMNDDTTKLLNSLNHTDRYVLNNNKTNTRYERGWAIHGVKRVFRTLKFPEDFSAHNLRHTFASHLVMKGVHIKVIAELLGQSYDRTALIYSHLDTTTLEKASNLLQFTKF